MDASLFAGGRNTAWGETMVNMEARKLVSTANVLSGLHLRDSLTRINFVEEIKRVVEQQFTIARRAKSNEEFVECIRNLRAETENLQEQDRMLQSKAAKLYAKVEFVTQNNVIVGYVISAVHIVVSGLAILAGGLAISTMTPVGMLAGAIVVLDGINGISKEVIPMLYGRESKTEGILADGAMETAKFMGFKPESGLAFYDAFTLTASIYTVFGVAGKPGAWRLFKWVPRDYYRQVDSMSRPKLTMRIVGYGIKAKVIFDLMSIDRSND